MVARVQAMAVAGLVATVLAVAIRAVAALLDVPVEVPERGGDGTVALGLDRIVTVVVVVTVLAAVVTWALDQVRPASSRTIVRRVGLVVLLLSLVPVGAASDDLPVANLVVLALLHVVVAAVVLRRVVRDG